MSEPKKKFDPSTFALPQDFNVDVQNRITRVQVRKPPKQLFVRVRNDSAYSINTYLLELDETKESFVVDKDIIASVESEARAVTLVLGITRQGDIFLWPLNIPKSNTKVNTWNESAIRCASAAKHNWVRVIPNHGIGAYEIIEAASEIPEPQWPELSMAEILEIAFGDRIIDSVTHPALRKLRGE